MRGEIETRFGRRNLALSIIRSELSLDRLDLLVANVAVKDRWLASFFERTRLFIFQQKLLTAEKALFS